MATYWNQNWASLATVIQVTGQAVEEGAYSAEAVWGFDLPNTSCIEDWVAKMPQLNLGARLIPPHGEMKRIDGRYKTKTCSDNQNVCPAYWHIYPRVQVTETFLRRKNVPMRFAGDAKRSEGDTQRLLLDLTKFRKDAEV